MLATRLIVAVVGAALLLPGAVEAATPIAQTGPGTTACQTATATVTKAKTTLSRANRALSRATTAKAKRAARKRVAAARSALRAARRKQAKACTAPPNQPPAFPSPVQISTSTEMSYDDNGRIQGATTTIEILTPATDPDGDMLTYAWTASNGSIAGDGLHASWQRVLVGGRVQPGTVTVTVTDGRGGQAQHVIEMHR